MSPQRPPPRPRRLPRAAPLRIGVALAALLGAPACDDSALGGGAGDGGTDARASLLPDGAGAPDGGPAPTACTGRLAQPLDSTWTVHVGERDRTFNVHVPKSYDPAHRIPVVIDFHGYTSNGEQQDVLAGMSKKADGAGFVAVHPQGVMSSWNAGACCGYAVQNGVDDIGFVKRMLEELDMRLCVDPHRIYATGMSNGGFFSHRLGCELADRFAAVAPVAGVMAMPMCHPSRPMPLLHFHGTADGLVPYDGSKGLGFPPVPESFAGWAARDGCTGDPVETFNKGDARCVTYQHCAGGAEVGLCTISGGGHTWPGGFPVPSLGKTSTDLSATDAMWTFFEKHPLP